MSDIILMCMPSLSHIDEHNNNTQSIPIQVLITHNWSKQSACAKGVVSDMSEEEKPGRVDVGMSDQVHMRADTGNEDPHRCEQKCLDLLLNFYNAELLQCCR